MENENNSNKDPSKRTTYQKNTEETERHAKSKIFIIKDTSEEKEERFSIKETNSFQKEAMKENNEILKETITSKSFPKRVDNTKKYDKSKREINNPGKIGDIATVMADKYRCQRPLRDIIGKREQRREELEKMEGDLRQRLDMLECSIPAVMIWNIWRMSQGVPVCRIKRILEKQFKDTRELSCRSTPSCHYDCRVREVEAERKLALKKVEEARTLWLEKLATLEERKRKLDEARKIQEEQRNVIEQLNEENRMLQEAMEKKAIEIDESCQCGDTQCKQRHLSKVSSVTSIEFGDIQCLEKLQRLAEEEVITKREIAELERREEAYMRTLQQADELWSKIEGDMVTTTSALQEQLDMKTTANQQLANRVCELEDALEKCRTRLVTCRTELEKFLSIEKVEATIGRDDDVAKVVDKEVAVKAKVVHRPIGRIDDIATVKDDEVLAKVEVVDEEVLAKTKVVNEEALAITEVEDKEALARVVLVGADIETIFIDELVSVKPDVVDLAVDRPVDVAVDRPVDVAVDRLVDVAVDRPVDVAADRPVDLAIDRPVDLAVDRPVDVAVDRPVDLAVDRPVDLAVDRPVDLAVDRPVDLAVDRPVDVAVDRPVDVAVDRPVDLAVDRPVDIAVDRPVDIAVDRPVDLAVERPVDLAVDRPVDLAVDRPVDLAVDRPVDLAPIKDAEGIVRPEDIAYEQQRYKEAREYLAQLGSLEELYTDDGVPCAHDFVCNDVITLPVGMTDEEFIALSVEHPVLTKETVITEEGEKPFKKELVKKLHNEVEKREKKEDEIPGIEIERKIAEKAEVEKRVAKVDDVKETVTSRAIEETADDRLVTMPKNRAPEVNNTEARKKQNQNVMIQRKTILSWIDAIDTIRTTAAKHPDCHVVKKDADTLAKQVRMYIGIKPKEMEEENATINAEDELIILKAKEIKPAIKIDSEPFLNSEEASAEVKASIEAEAIAEAELLPTFTKEEEPIDIKLPTTISMKDSFQPPTMDDQKILKDDTLPLISKPDIEIKVEETRVEKIEMFLKNKNAERKAIVKALINNILTKLEAIDKTVNSIDEEKMLTVPKIEKNDEKEKEIKIPREIKIKEITVKNEKADKVLPVTEIEESELVEWVAEKSEEISPLDETKISDMKEMIPPMEIVEMIPPMETVEVSPISEKKEIEQEEIIPVVDVKEVKKMIPETISPTVDITEVEKFEPDKFPIVDVEKAPIAKAIEEKIKMEEPTSILNGKEDSLLLDAVIKEKIEKEKPAIKKEKIETAKMLLIAEIVKEEKNEVTELSPIEVMEKKEKNEAIKLPPISNIVREEKIETVELPSISDMAKEKIETAKVSPITDIVKKKQIEAAELPNMAKKEKIEVKKLLHADVVTEEKIEIIQPIPTISMIKKEMEEKIEDLKKMLEVKIKKEKDKEIKKILPEEVIPSIELFEKKEEEEIPQIKKEEIPQIKKEEISQIKKEEIPQIKKEETPTKLLKKSTSKIKREVSKKRSEIVQIELKNPITETKSTEMEIPVIPLDLRLVVQPYLIIAKIKEKELLQIAKPPCTECCLRPPIETTKQLEIPQTDVPQTEVVQTEVIQSEVVQTKMMQTEIVQNEVNEQAKVVQTESIKTAVVQITSQAISTTEPPRIQNISEYLKPAELKASRTETAGDRPEITGRKMLWRKRLKDQSTVTTSSIGSQTDKTSHVSHDRVVRDERERARVPTDELLRSIKIATMLARPDTEREIRTINYGGKSDEMGRTACNCCACGKTPIPSSTRPRLEVQPQIDATPPAAATFKRMFIRPKIDHPILHDRLCSDCKAKIQSRMPQEKHHIEKIIKKISHDQESCRYVSLTSKSCRAISQKRIIIKRDQACLAKISKQKFNPIEQKRKDNLQSILEEKSTVEPLSASCICFKLEKTGESIKKGNCYCGD